MIWNLDLDLGFGFWIWIYMFSFLRIFKSSSSKWDGMAWYIAYLTLSWCMKWVHDMSAWTLYCLNLLMWGTTVVTGMQVNMVS